MSVAPAVAGITTTKEAIELERRRAKVARMRAAGVDPYPHRFPGRVEIAAVHAAHDPAALEPGEHPGTTYRVAGRLVGRRGHGATTFADVRDRSGSIQLFARREAVGDELYERVLDLDLGDLVGVDGCLHVTKRGQLTLAVRDCTVVAKALRPPPGKHHGIEDPDLRYRHRELDLMTDGSTRELFLLRARLMRALRDFMDGDGFVEVDPPVLEGMYGGASARPFVTRSNALDRDAYLRISSELYLKRFVVGGLEKVYDLGRFFRNEGISHNHSPEFTMLEWMDSYIDYMELATFVERLVEHVARRVLGTTRIERDGQAIQLAGPWRRVTQREAIREVTGIDVAGAGGEQLAAALGERVTAASTRGQLVNALYAKRVEPTLVQPTIVYDFPAEQLPLTKRTPRDAQLAAGFDAVIGGVEISTGASELNDPDEQRARLIEQQRRHAGGDAHPLDEDFLHALEHGMAPVGGAGIGVERLLMLLAGRASLREVTSFPLLRPRG
jgi:lysyl-tRNA synthetase, class II